MSGEWLGDLDPQRTALGPMLTGKFMRRARLDVYHGCARRNSSSGASAARRHVDDGAQATESLSQNDTGTPASDPTPTLVVAAGRSGVETQADIADKRPRSAVLRPDQTSREESRQIEMCREPVPERTNPARPQSASRPGTQVTRSSGSGRCLCPPSGDWRAIPLS